MTSVFSALNSSICAWIVGNLPNAVGSPDAAIENDDGVFAFEIGGNIQVDHRRWHLEVRKWIAGTELFRSGWFTPSLISSYLDASAPIIRFAQV